MPELNDNQLDNLCSAMWHIASSLKKIELNLEAIDGHSSNLSDISLSLEAFSPAFSETHPKGRFGRLVELLEEAEYMKRQKL